MYPRGKLRLYTNLDDYWQSIFSESNTNILHRGVHWRSNAAQILTDIEGKPFLSGEKLGIDIINFSTHKVIVANNNLKVGNPYWFKAPLSGKELEDLISAVSLIEPEDDREITILNKDNAELFGFNVKYHFLTSGHLIALPLTTAYIPEGIYKDLVLQNLPSGPDRKPLHDAIGINPEGKLITFYEMPKNAHLPLMQLAGTSQIQMPVDTALNLKYCVKYVNDEPILTPHSSSNLHVSTALVAGTSSYAPGDKYEHRIITESYNYVFQDIYPSYAICEAFNLRVV